MYIAVVLSVSLSPVFMRPPVERSVLWHCNFRLLCFRIGLTFFMRHFNKVKQRVLWYSAFRLSVRYTCESLLLRNYFASYWDETLGICRTISTFCGIQFLEILGYWKDKFENIYLWSDFHENWYTKSLYMRHYETKVRIDFFCKWGPPCPPLI